VQTALNAVAGIVRHLGGTSHDDNPGPCEAYPRIGPVALAD
jgi:tryptophan 2-monooxygenase